MPITKLSHDLPRLLIEHTPCEQQAYQFYYRSSYNIIFMHMAISSKENQIFLWIDRHS